MIPIRIGTIKAAGAIAMVFRFCFDDNTVRAQIVMPDVDFFSFAKKKSNVI
jgi:hypothetical protein